MTLFVRKLKELNKKLSKQEGFFNTIYRLLKHPLGSFGAFLIFVLILVALLTNLIAPYSFNEGVGSKLEDPSLKHLSGTDNLRRDVFSRTIFGSRISLFVGLVSVSLALAFGGTAGLVAGFYGGVLDSLIMRLVDILMTFPGLVLAIFLSSILGPSLRNTALALAIVYAPRFARTIRGQTLSISENDYIESAKAVSASNFRIITRHILPNSIAPIVVQSSVVMAGAILSEAGLSFLGLGAQPPTPSWGQMLSIGQRYLELQPWFALTPGIAISLTVLGFNFLGDGLRDVLDPRLKNTS